MCIGRQVGSTSHLAMGAARLCDVATSPHACDLDVPGHTSGWVGGWAGAWVGGWVGGWLRATFVDRSEVDWRTWNSHFFDSNS